MPRRSMAIPCVASARLGVASRACSAWLAHVVHGPRTQVSAADLRRSGRPGARQPHARQRDRAAAASPTRSCSRARAASARRPPRASSPRRSTASRARRPSRATCAMPCTRDHDRARISTCWRSTAPRTTASTTCAGCRRSLPFRPARDRFKVVIVDEVHMLSTGAFNAFLKTLEEPPPHVKFIFATTEIHKVPITIRSRCQRYDFRLIPHAVVARACARSWRAKRSRPTTPRSRSWRARPRARMRDALTRARSAAGVRRRRA